MITWIRENTALFSLVTGAVIFISTVAVGWHELQGLVAWQPIVEQHMDDTARHVNPEEAKQTQERLEKLEERVRELEMRQRMRRGQERGRR